MFPLLKDNPQVFSNWLQLVKTYKVQGKRSHDLRLIAVMQTYQVTHLLTFNPSDFPNVTGIVIVHPQDLLASQSTS